VTVVRLKDMDNNIMVVDGSSVSRELIARRLEDALPGTRVTACSTAAEALRQLEGTRFSLITTALMLPDADGLDLCRKVRSSKLHHYTPLIVISSDADQRLMHEGFAAGVSDYFDKSRGFKAFGRFIKEFLKRYPGLYGRVLYIEDSRTVAVVTQGMLTQHGLDVVHTTTVEDALELLGEARDNPAKGFDLVITDFHLQGEMTGGDLLYVLRAGQHYSLQELPVLVITGNEDVSTQVEVFGAGANDFVIKPLVEEVVMARVRSLLLIRHQFDTMQRQAAELERMAGTDVLTGVHNRRFLIDQGQRFLNSDADAWAMIVDLDHFKRINDTYGHLIGDRVLIATGGLLNELFQDGLAARFGGEEFVVLLHGDDAPQRADEFRCRLEQLRPADVTVTVSVGLAPVAEHPDADLNSLLGIADQALYGAKAAGRNQVHLALTGGLVSPLAAWQSHHAAATG